MEKAFGDRVVCRSLTADGSAATPPIPAPVGGKSGSLRDSRPNPPVPPVLLEESLLFGPPMIPRESLRGDPCGVAAALREGLGVVLDPRLFARRSGGEATVEFGPTGLP